MATPTNQLLEKRLKLQRRKLAQQLRQDGAGDEEADWATEALEQEQDDERAALEAELEQAQSDIVNELHAAGGGTASAGGSDDDPDGLLAAEREAQILRDAQLAAEVAEKRAALENRLKLKRRNLVQQLRQDGVSEEEADLATEVKSPITILKKKAA